MSIFSSRRQFLKSLGLAAGAAAAGNALPGKAVEIPAGDHLWKSASPAAPRPSGSTYMGGFKAPRLGRIRMAFIGVGGRGFSHLAQMCVMDGVEIVGICDLKEELTKRGVDRVLSRMGKSPLGYSGGDMEYLTMLKELKPDAVIISTDWSSHARIACDSMKHGAHAFVEVPLAVSLEELWSLVDTSEATSRGGRVYPLPGDAAGGHAWGRGLAAGISYQDQWQPVPHPRVGAGGSIYEFGAWRGPFLSCGGVRLSCSRAQCLR